MSAPGLISAPAPFESTPAVTNKAKKRGPSLARRTGQLGNVIQPNNKTGKWDATVACFGRFWVDIPGAERKRRAVPLGYCATKTIARKRLREHIEQLGLNTVAAFYQNTTATTFAEQAEEWLRNMKTRRRKPVKPATLSGWRYSLDKWLLPLVGELRLADVGNAALKRVIDTMTGSGSAAQSIVTITRVLKMVVASAVNEEGEQLYRRKWNHDFVGLPIIDPTKQHRPTVTKEEVEKYIMTINPRFRILVALLAGTGLRIGEALGLKTTDLEENCCVLRISRSVWNCQEQSPKTPNAVRVVDVHESLARVLREYIVGRSGLLFATRDGKPLSTRNVLRSLLNAGGTCGFHAFRRFRAETLRRERVPEDLVRFWLGHADANVTDTYANGLRQDLAWRQEWAQRAGLGFNLNGSIGVNVVKMVRVKRVA